MPTYRNPAGRENSPRGGQPQTAALPRRIRICTIRARLRARAGTRARVSVHGRRVTAAQLRTRFGSIGANPIRIAPTAAPKTRRRETMKEASVSRITWNKGFWF
jgi:hypothetical protein